MALGDPIFGPSFGRVYQALTVALVREAAPRVNRSTWGCSECSAVWLGHSLAPTHHAASCSLYLSPKLTGELLEILASRGVDVSIAAE